MFHNREIRQFSLALAAIAALSCAAGFAIHPAAGLLSLVSAAAFAAAFFAFTRARYQSIARISEQIDLVLHHEDCLFISEEEEGELSVLRSEIGKMTLRLREQNSALRQEKEHLADSLADIAHQLRTPLTSSNLILTLLESNPDARERRTLVRRAQALLMQMDWLLTSLLKLSRLDAGIVAFEREMVHVRDLIGSALAPLEIAMELRGIAVQIDVPENAQIRGDEKWLTEAVGNILKNCMESVGENGTIDVMCEDNLLYTQITVHDSGAGFEEEDMRHAFDRFYRGKHAGAAGYGIGLALCKTIVMRQGGTVCVKNHPQGGAVFSLRFPK